MDYKWLSSCCVLGWHAVPAALHLIETAVLRIKVLLFWPHLTSPAPLKVPSLQRAQSPCAHRQALQKSNTQASFKGRNCLRVLDARNGCSLYPNAPLLPMSQAPPISSRITGSSQTPLPVQNPELSLCLEMPFVLYSRLSGQGIITPSILRHASTEGGSLLWAWTLTWAPGYRLGSTLLGRESVRGCLAPVLNSSPAAHSPSSSGGCSGHTSQQVQDKDAGGKEQSPGESVGGQQCPTLPG